VRRAPGLNEGWSWYRFVGELSIRLVSDTRIDKFEVPRVTSLIREVRFYDSMIVLFKDANCTVPVG